MAVSLVNEWNYIFDKNKKNNETMASLVSQSTSSYFSKIEINIELLAKQLLKNNVYQDSEASRKLFKEMLIVDPSIAGFALIAPNGDFVASDLDIDPSKMPNVKLRAQAADSFQQTIDSKALTIGRTYFLPMAKKWVIPVRKAFYDASGQPEIVISLAVSVDSSKLLDERLLVNDVSAINLFRDNDRYWQLFVSKNTPSHDIYNHQISKERYSEAMRQVSQGKPDVIKDIKRLQKLSSLKLTALDGQQYLVSSIYTPQHQLWATSYIEWRKVTAEFKQKSLIIIATYVGVLIGLFYLFRHINYLQRKDRAALKYRASHDPLTDLPNRYSLDEHIQSGGPDQAFCLILIDFDNFKLINDSYGHQMGDLLLIAMANRLSLVIEEQDALYRKSGDEFIIYRNRLDNVYDFCHRLSDVIKQRIDIMGNSFYIHASMGIVEHPKHGNNFDELMIHADIALYEAKKARNRFVIFHQSDKEQFIRNNEIEDALKMAVQDQEFSVVYQPQLSRDGTVYGIEALIRWRSHKLGFISPNQFIPIAEKSGMMREIGMHVIEKSLRQFALVSEKFSFEFNLSINVSPSQFSDEFFPHQLLELTRANNLSPHQITLEITESLFIKDIYNFDVIFNQLKDAGYLISMDDFGTGYSSLSMLRKISFDEIKIDKSFVDDIVHSDAAKEMIKAIISIAKLSNNCVVLAEGVETPEQLAILESFDCDKYQGYHFSKPLSVEQLQAYLSDKSYTNALSVN